MEWKLEFTNKYYGNLLQKASARLGFEMVHQVYKRWNSVKLGQLLHQWHGRYSREGYIRGVETKYSSTAQTAGMKQMVFIVERWRMAILQRLILNWRIHLWDKAAIASHLQNLTGDMEAIKKQVSNDFHDKLHSHAVAKLKHVISLWRNGTLARIMATWYSKANREAERKEFMEALYYERQLAEQDKSEAGRVLHTAVRTQTMSVSKVERHKWGLICMKKCLYAWTKSAFGRLVYNWKANVWLFKHENAHELLYNATHGLTRNQAERRKFSMIRMKKALYSWTKNSAGIMLYTWRQKQLNAAKRQRRDIQMKKCCYMLMKNETGAVVCIWRGRMWSCKHNLVNHLRSAEQSKFLDNATTQKEDRKKAGMISMKRVVYKWKKDLVGLLLYDWRKKVFRAQTIAILL